MRFSEEAYLIMFSAIVVVDAHITTRNYERDLLKEALEAINKNPRFRVTFKLLYVSYRYKTIVYAFNEADRRNRFQAGTGGEHSELGGILIFVVHAVSDIKYVN